MYHVNNSWHVYRPVSGSSGLRNMRHTSPISRTTTRGSGSGRDITAVAGSLPETPGKQVVRENILSTLDDMFNSGIQLLTVEGAEEIGKTTLLLQFAKRHPVNSISIFIRPTSWFSYDPQILLRDMCNQMQVALQGRELRLDEETDESYFRQLLFGLTRLAARENTDFYFVVDGIEDVPDEAQSRIAVISLLPVGVPRIKCLIAIQPERILRYLKGRFTHKSYVLSGFALEETFAFFSDLNIDRKFFEELYKVSSRGVPGQIASIRRLLESGISPEGLLNELPEKLPNLFDLEWRAVDTADETLLNLLTLVSQLTPKHSILDLALITQQSTDKVRSSLASLAFVRVPTDDRGVAEFISDRFRRHVETRLLSRRPAVQRMAIDYFLEHPRTDNALALLPTYLERAGKPEELIEYLTPEHFSTIVERSGSLLPVRQNAGLGVSSAFALGRDGDLLRFGIQRAALHQFDRFSTLRSEIRARMALGEYDEAVSAAQAAVLIPDRVRLLAVIARWQKENGLTPKPELLEQIELLCGQITPEELGSRAAHLAADLMYSRPDLAINLAERLPRLSREETEHDWSLARLSVDAAVSAQKDKVGFESRFATIRERITDPAARQFSSAVSILLNRYSADDIVAEVQRVASPGDKIFLLRLWCRFTRDRENSADIIDHAIKLVITTSDYAPTATDLRDLATPLPYVADKAKIGRLIAAFDSQRGQLKKQGPTEDYVQLQLTLAQAEAAISPEGAGKRLQEIYFDIASIKDLETKTSCTGRTMAALPVIDPKSDIPETSIVALFVEEEFHRELNDLLGSTADHFNVAASMIDALAATMPREGLRLAQMLNAEPRRDQAKVRLVEAALAQPFGSIPLDFLAEIIDQITDPDDAEKCVERVLHRAQEEARDERLKARIGEIIPFVDKSCTLSEVKLRCNACGSAAAILARVGEPKYAGLLEKILERLRLGWEAMDGGVQKVDMAYTLASLLAKHARTEAIYYLGRGQELKRDPQLDCGRHFYVGSLRLAIRAFAGLLPSRLESEEDVQGLSAAIDRVPGFLSRVGMWTEVALRYVKASRRDDAQRIVSQRLQPLLEILQKQDASLWKRAVLTASPALYQTHAPSALELVAKLPPLWRDSALNSIIKFILRRVPPNDPFENREDQCNLSWPSATDICDLLSLAERDSLIYGHIETLVQSAVWKHNETPFTQEQKNQLAQRLTKLVAEKLPNPRFIAHDGFVVASHAQIAKLQKQKGTFWEDLVVQGRSIPNVCDRVYVLGIIADALPGDLRSRKIELLEEAHKLADSIPVLIDRLDRLEILATFAADVDRSMAKKILAHAWDVLARTDDPEGEPVERQLVDLTYRVDPEGAAKLAASLDTDEGRQRARDRIKYNEFRQDLMNKQDAPLEASGQDLVRLAEVALTLLGQLNANRIETRHVKALRDWVKLASTGSLENAYPIFSLAIENAICRLARASDGRMLLREMCDASMASCNLMAAIASRQSTVVQSRAPLASVNQSNEIFVHAGERQQALAYLRRWLEAHGDSYLQICDPWFGVKDLEALQLVLEVAPGLEVTILTSKRQQDNDGLTGDYRREYREYWEKHFSDQEPPRTELAIVGTQTTGELPIHDRWWLTRGAGLRIGTSFNALGRKGGAEISELTDAGVSERQAEAEDYLTRRKREHLGQKLNFAFVTV